jgi:pimeloyl-ACP methyl ester carboxylesterase
MTMKENPALDKSELAGYEVWTAGKGPDVVVVHGGPGFSHRYLVRDLLPLARSCRLIFYDQLTRPPEGEETLTAEHLTTQLSSIVRTLESPALLTHSWGSYLAYSVLDGPSASQIRAAVLVSPVGLDHWRFRLAQKRQAQRIPVGLASRYPFDLDYMNAALPYYFAANNRDRVDLRLHRFIPTAMKAILASIEGYDYRAIATRKPRQTRLHLVYGDSDALSPTDTLEAFESATITLIEGTAHFPQAEDPSAFLSAVEPFLT